MSITRAQAEQLAILTAAARPHGAAQWDPAGIVRAIEKVAHLDLAEVMKACARAAQDRTIRTPAPIGDTTSSAWRERVHDVATPTKPRRCRIHGTQHYGGICASCRADELAADPPTAPPASRGRLDPDSAASAVAELRDRTHQAPAPAGASSYPEENPA